LPSPELDPENETIAKVEPCPRRRDSARAGHEAGSEEAQRGLQNEGGAVELVDEGQDRHVAQPADLEELAGLLLDPLAASSTITALSTAVSVR
jgi:hypothetical protein